MDHKSRPPNLNLQGLMTQKKDLGRKFSKRSLFGGESKHAQWKDVKEWKVVSQSVSALFNGKKLGSHEFEKIYGIVSSCANSEMGGLMCALYQEHILKRSMIILREDIKEKHGRSLLNRLSDVWDRFYGVLLPMLQAIFHTITTHGLNIRQLTLQSFRDIVVLKTEVKQAVDASPGNISPAIRQMLLVLLSVHDTPHPSENYLELEEIASKVIEPLLGAKFLYAKTIKSKENDHVEGLSVMSSDSSGASIESPRSGQKKSVRPVSMIEQSDKDPDFDDLIHYRRQQMNRYSYGGRLSAVSEGSQSLGSSFGSLIDD